MDSTRMANRISIAAALLAVVIFAGATTRAADVATSPDSLLLSSEELEQTLAGIALYPDVLLAQVLMASTYPLEVADADRWIYRNRDLAGDPLAAALEAQTWDSSVKALVNFPRVLAMMSENPDVTGRIADALIRQPKQVMDTIQALRFKAQDMKYLISTPEQNVITETHGATRIIVIEAADPQVIFVPTHGPTVYYAVWPRPAEPDVYYYPHGYVRYPGCAFAPGVTVGPAWGYAWGHCNWRSGYVEIDVDRNISLNSGIDRSRYKTNLEFRFPGIQNGKGIFHSDPARRQGTADRQETAANP